MTSSSNEPKTSLPVLKGKQVILRSPRASDKKDRIAFGRDPEYRRMVGVDPQTQRPLTESEVENWFARVTQEPYGWVIECEERCIGEARLHSPDWPNRRARYSVGIYGRTYWNRGLGAEVTNLVLAYAFETLKLHRVDLRVLESNERAIACYEKCGFAREGIEREGAWLEGRWQSDVMMSMLEQDWNRGQR